MSENNEAEESIESLIEEEPTLRCHPCGGRGKHFEKIEPDDPGAWFECTCCNGTGTVLGQNAKAQESR